ncbi:MAG TPA: helix-turn-helix transcriptional regulator [Solirubrobacter sp.]|nr:helix-turn-helix transcriptional regulator [Solirubrobacter sp.]
MSTHNQALFTVRKAKGLTQGALAERVGVATSTVAFIELGQREPTLRVALRIAKVLGASVERLFADHMEAAR